MDNLLDLLFKQGGLIQFVVLIVPGFVAWKTYQLKRPQGAQKPADAIIEILTFSVFTRLVWYAGNWTTWPSTLGGAILLFLQVVVTPIGIVLLYLAIIDFCAKKYWILSPHPRAWDFIFNGLAYRTTGIGANGLFLIVTLSNGDKVAGVYSEPGFASLWPYDGDLLFGPTWELNNGVPEREVEGSIGIFVEEKNILSIEVFDYDSVVQSVSTDGEE